MKFGQLIEHNNRSIFFKNHTEVDAGRRVPDHFFNFKKALYELTVGTSVM